MNRSRCKRCGNMAHDENNPCHNHKEFGYVYPQSGKQELVKNNDVINEKNTKTSDDDSEDLIQPDGQNKCTKSELINLPQFPNREKVKSLALKRKMCRSAEDSSDNARSRAACDIPYCSSDFGAQETEIKTNEDATFTDAPGKSLLGSRSSNADKQKQGGSAVSDQSPITPDEECEMPFEHRNCHSLNNIKIDFMDALERVISNSLSGNTNISGTTNSNVNLDLRPGSKKPKAESDGVIDEHFSAHAHNNTNRASNLKEFHHSKGDDNAVAGPSGMCPIKKFPCNSCSKEFHRKYDLKIHYRTHTGDNLFTCDICKKRFSTKWAIDQHYRTHTGERPYECDKCGTKFSHLGNLNRHYHSHMGKTPYKCPICGMAFLTSSSCCKHRRTKH